MTVTSIYKKYIPACETRSSNCKEAWMFVFRGNQILVETHIERPTIPTSEDLKGIIQQGTPMLCIGELEQRPCFCLDVDNILITSDKMEFHDLRSLLGQLEEDIFLLAGRAFQIINWNRMTTFCGKCGSVTEIQQRELVKKCPECNSLFYPRISPAIIVSVIRGDKILLAHNKNFKSNWYSVIAGFVEPGETFEDCVKREVMEEVGIQVANIRYFSSQPWPFPDSLMVGFIAEYQSGEIVVDDVEIEAADWFIYDNLPTTPDMTTIAGQLIQSFVHEVKKRIDS
ncbi:MAG: NAD(+) diphosphatase [Bacillota bacterium]|nr:NAD(+) diphosphatase [Bacillota bacterium]